MTRRGPPEEGDDGVLYEGAKGGRIVGLRGLGLRGLGFRV